jgi:hypothetical protein
MEEVARCRVGRVQRTCLCLGVTWEETKLPMTRLTDGFEMPKETA